MRLASAAFGAILFASLVAGSATANAAGMPCGFLGTSGNCPDNTPICTTGSACMACTKDSDCTPLLGSQLPGTCVTEGINKGACFRCSGDNVPDAGGTLCPDPLFPACNQQTGALQYRCTQCTGSNDTLCAPHKDQTPSCVVDHGQCGCIGTDCGGGTCNKSILPAGECVSTGGCDASTCKGSTGVCDSQRNSCVECLPSSNDCDGGLTCDPTLEICVAPSAVFDAGADGGGGESGDGSVSGDDGGGQMSDGGTSTGPTDGSTTENPDATLNGGGSSGNYPYGHVEGGGCSTSGTAGFGSAFAGLFALAGMLSIRTKARARSRTKARRRNGEDRR